MKLRFLMALALAAGLTGCAENRASFFIQQINVPSSECIVESDEESPYRTGGVLDVGFTDSYVLTPLLRNQLSPRGEPESLVAETNGIQVEGANIQIWRGGRPQGATVYSFYPQAASYVPPQDVTASRFVAVHDVAVDALLRAFFEGADPGSLTFDELRQYEDLITIGVRMHGTTSGNVDVETPEFYFPIRLCFGCLVVCPSDSADPDNDPPLPLCESAEEPESYGCFFGQDTSIDCRWCVPAYGAGNCRSLCTYGL